MDNLKLLNPADLINLVIDSEFNDVRRILNKFASNGFEIILEGETWHGQQDERVAKIVNSVYESLSKYYYDLYGAHIPETLMESFRLNFTVSKKCTDIKIENLDKILLEGMDKFQTDKSKLIYVGMVLIFFALGISAIISFHLYEKSIELQDRQDERQKWYETINASRGKVIENDTVSKSLVDVMSDSDTVQYKPSDKILTKADIKKLKIKTDKEIITIKADCGFYSITETEDGNYSCKLKTDSAELSGRKANLNISYAQVQNVIEAMRSGATVGCTIEYRKNKDKIEYIKVLLID